jgi:hypothetical protein
MSVLGARCRSPLGAFYRSPLGAFGCPGCRDTLVLSIVGLTPCSCHETGGGASASASWLVDPNGSHTVTLFDDTGGTCAYSVASVGSLSATFYTGATDCTGTSFTSNPTLSARVEVNQSTGRVTHVRVRAGFGGNVFEWTGNAKKGEQLDNEIASCPSGTGVDKAYGGHVVVSNT